MDIQEKLKEWANKTAKGYVSIAKEIGEDKPGTGFYTQSNLTKVLGSPNVLIIGINPGSEGSYICQKTNPNWGLNGNDMDGEHLIQGNYCKNKEGNPNWSDRNKWPFWNRLKAYFRNVLPENPLEKEENFVLTNISFFNSKQAHILIKSIPFTMDLIKILAPRHIVFLGGVGTLNILKRANQNNTLFELNYELTNPRVYKGQFNGIPFLSVPHPSAHLTKEERQIVVDRITDYMNE